MSLRSLYLVVLNKNLDSYLLQKLVADVACLHHTGDLHHSLKTRIIKLINKIYRIMQVTL